MRIGLLAAAVAAVLALASPAAAQQTTQRGTVLAVNAIGVSEARPDMAVVNLGVATSGSTAQAALADNSRRMETVIQALRRAGIAERDIQTSNVSVYPRYTRDDTPSPQLSGYRAENTVRARVRAINNVGRVIDAAVSAGGNTVQGVSFMHQEPETHLDRARQDAIRVARGRATLYATALGQTVGRVISVTEAGAAFPPGEDQIIVTGSRIGGSYAPPIAPGELETRISVSVSFELR